MVELDRTNEVNRIKDFSGILKRNVGTAEYLDYLKLNEVTDLNNELKIRAELKHRGYSLRAKVFYSKPKRISYKELIKQLILNTSD